MKSINLFNKVFGELLNKAKYSLVLILLSSGIVGAISGYLSYPPLKNYLTGKENYIAAFVATSLVLLMLMIIIIIKEENKDKKIEEIKARICHSFSTALNESKINPDNNYKKLKGDS